MRHSLGLFLRFNDYLFVDLLESNFGKRAMYLCVNYVIVSKQWKIVILYAPAYGRQIQSDEEGA